jgi:hypothetical protein
MAIDLNIQEKFNIQDLKEILKTEFPQFITTVEKDVLINLNSDLIGLSDLYIDELGYTEDEASASYLGAIEFYNNN